MTDRKIIPFYRAQPRLVRPAPDRLHREVADMDAFLNRPVRKPEPSRGNRLTATIAFWVVGLTGAYFVGRYLAVLL